MKHTFRALSLPNYRLYLTGQVISLLGTWIQQVALAWITYRTTGSPLMLGAIAFVGQMPLIFLTPVGGWLADHQDPRRIVYCTQALEMTLAAALALVAYYGAFSVSLLFAAALLSGLTAAFELPARQTFLPEVVSDRKLLPNAIALSSTSLHAARLLGPAIGGALLAGVGDTWCFALNAVSFLAVFITLSRLSLHPQRLARKPRVPFAEGLAFIRARPEIRLMLATVAGASFALAPFATLLPVYAQDVFAGGPDVLGSLMAASGTGSLMAGLWLASHKKVAPLPRAIRWALLSAAVAIAGFSHNRLLSLALLCCLLSGASTSVVLTAGSMLLQTLVPLKLRGRVLSFYTMAFLGVLPVGGLLWGALAGRLGSQNVFLCSALIELALFGYFSRRYLALTAALAAEDRKSGPPA